MHTKEEPQKVYARRYSPRLKDRPVVLNFGKNGRVYSGLGYKEAGPIEDRLRDEYPGLFRNGFRFAMNCENDNRKIRKAIEGLNLPKKLIAVFTPPSLCTFDSGGRTLDGYVAIFVGNANIMDVYQGH